ncbi:MAG: type III-A CRISPR-associated RAMP protein Csm5 [Thermus sp.]|uniref:type III-A CRISPR-associated RAMP protein Csm5 n=1 Tax=Thermus sp. TaxID=275 RepID=UPI00298F185A|nr:type III-A CRISPR-associated RAMP protein Csm5 [Thermus sp.]MDW8018192.1 type III-A CRISPR-associated RAMP protein Csm5 [Thermus sp.]
MSFLEAYTLELELLSPVHVGTGEAYPAYAYVPDFERKQVHLLDPSALLLALTPERQKAFLRKVAEGPKGAQDILRHLYREGQIPQEAIRRTLPASQAFLSTIQEATEEATLEYRPLPYSPLGPYLPGSSVKGALRTAWLYWKLVQGGKVLELQGKIWRFRPKGTQDGQTFISLSPKARVGLQENQAFEGEVLGYGRNLYRDPFRAVRLTDSEPAEGFLNRIGIFHPRGKMDGTLLLAETFRIGSRFRFLFRYQGGLAANKGVAGAVPPGELVQALREYYGYVAEWEEKYAEEYRLEKALKVYEQLREKTQDPQTFPIRIGFGSGRLALRLALILPQDHPEAQDPTTRKTAGARKPKDGYPLGWAVGRLVPRKG